MSRAFVKDADDTFEELPERPISSAPNWVTQKGLAHIEAEVARLTDEIANVRDDHYERARIGCDLRYWMARRASAQLMPASTRMDIVRFGATVTIDRDDGRHEAFRIVGEDEADPSEGTISYVSPLARALMGKAAGDRVRVNGTWIDLVAIA